MLTTIIGTIKTVYSELIALNKVFLHSLISFLSLGNYEASISISDYIDQLVFSYGSVNVIITTVVVFFLIRIAIARITIGMESAYFLIKTISSKKDKTINSKNDAGSK